jgi:hypothetical protein
MRSSVLAYLSGGASVYLLIALLGIGVYARVLHVSRAAALAEVDAGRVREASLRTQLTTAEEARERAAGELTEAQQQLANALASRQTLESERDTLRGFLLTGRPLIVENRCSSRVRATIWFREVDGGWPHYGWWDFDPGIRATLVVRRNDGKIEEARATQGETYVYAATADFSWVYQGVNGEQERELDGARVRTLRKWYLPTDEAGNFVWALCSRT